MNVSAHSRLNSATSCYPITNFSILILESVIEKGPGLKQSTVKTGSSYRVVAGSFLTCSASGLLRVFFSLLSPRVQCFWEF